MAINMGVSLTMYQAYEGGKSVPSILVLVNLADSKKVSLDYLTGRTIPKIEMQEVPSADETKEDTQSLKAEIQSLKEQVAVLQLAVAKLAG